ncbi:MAG: M1 family metallopeptidase, partial [Tissierellia bacterium]|nr:M1 family metallopeptidase [Tissierellia bacterium]
MFKNIFIYFKLLYRYFVYRCIEGKGSNTYFTIQNRKFNLDIDFNKKALRNKAIYNIKSLKNRKKITFWIGFQESVKIERVKINNIDHSNFKLYSVIVPIFSFRVNYLVLNKIDNRKMGENIEVIIEYSIEMANNRDDFSTMLENYIIEDEFHLYCLWYPIMGSCLTIRDILSGNIPSAIKCPFEIKVNLSKEGIVIGEGKVIKESEKTYIIRNFHDELNDIFICGGAINKIVYSSRDFNINFYFRISQQKHFDNFSEELFDGMDYIVKSLGNFELDDFNVYCIPIIAGGYGLYHGLLINENYFKVSSELNNYYKYTLLWHEFIHHWWGNRISSEDEGKYLLTEGMTILFEWLTIRIILGEEYFDLIIDSAVKDVLEISGFDRSIAEANRVPPFGNVIIYKKAPLVIYQLLNLVGENVFIDYCKTFLEEPGCYKWEEFIEGLEDYSSRDLTNYNNIWIREKSIPAYKWDRYIVLIDSRTEAEKDLDYHISQYKKDNDHNKLYKYLVDQSVHNQFWNKYYYYLSKCYFKNKNIKKAKECCDKLDKGCDIKYYWEGMYQKAKLEIMEDNIEKGLQIIKKIFQHSYPIQDTRGL